MATEEQSNSVTNYILQLLAIGLAVLFGVYTALTYPLSKGSLRQAEIANQLTLLSFCTSGASVNQSWTAHCVDVFQNPNLTDLVVTLVPQPATLKNGTTTGGRSNNEEKIAICLAVGFGLSAVLARTFSFYFAFQRQRADLRP